MGDEVDVFFEEVDLDNDDGGTQPGVRGMCSQCDHETESFGTSERSRRRCLALMHEECPMDESNYYVDAGDKE